MEQEISVAVAKYDYTAAGDGELTIRKNEKLVVIDDSQPWWKVQNEKSISGYVPSNYLTRKDSNKGKKNIIDNLKSKVLKNKRTSIDPIDPLTDVQNIKSKSGAKVLMVAFSKFKYTPQRDDELELNRGDQVLVIEMEHDGWCRGECNGKTGWFPFNYIQKVESNDGSPSEYADPVDVMDKPIISKVRTMYQFKSQSKEELSFEKDIILEIIDKPKDDPDWWRARKSNGEIGLVPRNYVEEIISPVLTPGPAKPKHSISSKNPNPTLVKDETPDNVFRDKDWYHGTLSRSECEFLLNEHAKDGEYLVRNSESKPGDFSLSMKAPNRIKHFKIHFANNQYVIGQRSFNSIDELVSHYKSSPIYTTEGGHKMYLLYPLNKSFTRNGVR